MIQKIILTRYIKLFCLIIALSSASCKTLFPQITDEEAKEVKNICGNLKVPTTFVKIEEKYTVKPNLASQKFQYSSADSPEDLDKYFVDQLTKTGWTYERDRGVKSISLLFKKDKYSIDIVIAYSIYLSTSNNLHIIDCSIGIN